jgi:hypothetical protein
MKKNLILLTGIVFLITILAAGGCNNDDRPIGSKKVTIYLKAVEIKGEKHLEMYDSNDTTIVVVDTLHTDVQDSTEVTWKLVDDSGIRKIMKISPKNGPGDIIPGPATGFLSPKKKKLKIPGNQKPDTEEAYNIKFKDTDGEKWVIDPFLRIPKKPGT